MYKKNTCNQEFPLLGGSGNDISQGKDENKIPKIDFILVYKKDPDEQCTRDRQDIYETNLKRRGLKLVNITDITNSRWNFVEFYRWNFVESYRWNFVESCRWNFVEFYRWNFVESYR
jgi:hypothetical protein